MKKVLYVADEDFTLSGITNRLETFTINNGCYPDVIEMDTKQIDRYISLLLYPCDRKKLTFRGIKIKEILIISKTSQVGFSTKEFFVKNK